MQHNSNYIQKMELSIEHIQNTHPSLDEIVKLVDGPWIAPSESFHHFSEEFLLDILTHSPITCAKIRGKYYVVGGFRSWNIANIHYKENGLSTQIPVQIIRRKMNPNQRIMFALSSLFASLLTHSLGANGQKHVGHLWEIIEQHSPNLYQQIFRDGNPSKSRLPAVLGKSFGSLYSTSNKEPKENCNDY